MLTLTQHTELDMRTIGPLAKSSPEASGQHPKRVRRDWRISRDPGKGWEGAPRGGRKDGGKRRKEEVALLKPAKMQRFRSLWARRPSPSRSIILGLARHRQEFSHSMDVESRVEKRNLHENAREQNKSGALQSTLRSTCGGSSELMIYRDTGKTRRKVNCAR